MDQRPPVSPHPGMLLREQMEYYDLGFPELAAAIGADIHELEDLAAERRPLTPALALRIARYFDASAESWMRCQAEADIDDETRRLADQLERITPIDPARGRDFDDEPLPEDVMADIRERMRDVDDPTRYLIRGDLFGDCDDERDPVFRLYFDLSSGMWSSSIYAATLFKHEADAEAIALRYGKRDRIVEFGPAEQREYLEERADRGRRDRFEDALRLVRRATIRTWEACRSLDSAEDMIAYLETAAGAGDPELLRDAVERVVRTAARLAHASREGS